MLESRRQLIQHFISFTGIIASASFLLPTSSALAQVPYKPSPNAPNPNCPQGMNGPGPTPSDQKSIDKQNQSQIRSDVPNVLMIADLKYQVEKTDTASTISVSVVKKAKEIEKIAKQVKDLAHG